MKMDVAKMIDTARRDPRVAGAYITLFGFIVGVYWFLNMRGFAFCDHYLTIAAAMQAMAFFLLGMKIRAFDIQGISPNMLYSYVIAYVTRLSTTFTFSGYLPEDETSEVYLYQSSEMLGLIVLLYNICTVRKMREQSSNLMEDVRHESRMVVPALCVLSLALGLLTKSDGHGHFVGDTLWMFSQWMDTFAIAPQLWIVAQQKVVERRTSHFIALMIAARVVLSLFWLLVIISQPLGWWFMVGILMSNVIHLVLCADYMYYFVMTIRQPTMMLPGMSL